MPQTAPSVHLFIREGGFEPGIGLHVPSTAFLKTATATAMATALAEILTDSLGFVRWEGRLANNSLVTGGSLAIGGNWPSTYTDMFDNVFVKLTSAGPARPSSFYLQGRAANIITDGVRNGVYATALDTAIAACIAEGLCDSEGNAVTGVQSWRPSRRDNVRVAP